jgi:CheY-like chemotaxis protein
MAPEPPCVLIVDDHADIRETLAEILTDEGYAVATATNGLDALEYLGGNRAPHLIILDLMMPVMDGREFRERQCAEPALSAIPVIVVSGADITEQQSGSLDAAAYFIKPVDLDTLLDTIAAYCRPAPPT